MDVFQHIVASPPTTHAARVSWEEKWEHKLSEAYSDPEGCKSELIQALFSSTLLNSETGAITHEFQVRNLLIFQASVARQLPQILAPPYDFKKSWRAMPQSARVELVMEGICRAMTNPTYALMRMCCPDSTVSRLTSRDGEVFLETAERFLPSEDTSPGTQPILFPNDAVDRVLTITNASAGMRERVKIWRSDVLGMILWRTICAFVSA